jgi:hypothetical protein
MTNDVSQRVNEILDSRTDQDAKQQRQDLADFNAEQMITHEAWESLKADVRKLAEFARNHHSCKQVGREVQRVETAILKETES